MMKTIVLDKDLAGTTNYGAGLPMNTSQKASYPEFSFSEDEPCDLPEEGELTIKYRLVRHATDTTDEAHPRYSYTVCVKKLISAEGEKDKRPAKSYDEAGDALDLLAASKLSEKEEY